MHSALYLEIIKKLDDLKYPEILKELKPGSTGPRSLQALVDEGMVALNEGKITPEECAEISQRAADILRTVEKTFKTG